MAELVLSNSKSTAKIGNFPANHGVTTRRFVNFGINENPMEREHNLLLMKLLNRNCFYKAITKHQAEISRVTLGGRIDNYISGDALICLRPENGLRPALIINTADCPAAFLTDAEKKFIAIVHTSRAETEMNIVGQTVHKLNEAYEIKPSEIIVGFWPGICRFCYPVNLRQEILDQLLDAGIDGLNIFIAENVCSAHSCLEGNFLFSSYRRDKNGERNAAYITF